MVATQLLGLTSRWQGGGSCWNMLVAGADHSQSAFEALVQKMKTLMIR
jgi:hypothetical protein